MQELIIQNIHVDFTRKNIKNINIRIVKPNAKVKVSAPYSTSMKKVEKFILDNKDWIERTQNKILKNVNNKYNAFLLSKDVELQTGSDIYVWGKKYSLEVLPSTRWNMVLDDRIMRANFYVTQIDDNNLKQQHLKKCYKDILMQEAAPIFKKWHDICGLAPSKIDVRFTKSVWGTCNNKTGRIMINGQLATMDPEFLDYVILHELTHLKYSNHGEDFKAFMTKYMPNWKQIRRKLNGQTESK